MEEEQVYTISLRDAIKSARKKRAAKASRLVKHFIKKRLGVSEVKIDSSLNEKIWSKGAEKPPSRVRVRATKLSDGVAEVFSLE